MKFGARYVAVERCIFDKLQYHRTRASRAKYAWNLSILAYFSSLSNTKKIVATLRIIVKFWCWWRLNDKRTLYKMICYTRGLETMYPVRLCSIKFKPWCLKKYILILKKNYQMFFNVLATRSENFVLGYQVVFEIKIILYM